MRLRLVLGNGERRGMQLTAALCKLTAGKLADVQLLMGRAACCCCLHCLSTSCGHLPSSCLTSLQSQRTTAEE